MSSLKQLLAEQKIIVCCGAGGVGKTSTSSALALTAARMGRNVLVITVDPSKRLAETMECSIDNSGPKPLPEKRSVELGIKDPGKLSIWVLNPQYVADTVVKRFAKTPDEAKRLLDNSMYRNISSMVAGMQEYTAVQAMYDFAVSGKYDLIVLDTPPSRNALNFLQAPNRIQYLLDNHIFRHFLPGHQSMFHRASTAMLNSALELVFGKEAAGDLLVFFDLFTSVFDRLSGCAGDVQHIFREKSTSFIVVTSPEQAAIDDADYFSSRSRQDLDLPFAGFIFNRSLINRRNLPRPEELDPPLAVSKAVMTELQYLAALEWQTISWQIGQYKKLSALLQKDEFIVSLPAIDGGISDLDSLLQMAQFIEAGRI